MTQILDTGVLRATSIQYLNDASEAEYGKSLIMAVANERALASDKKKGAFLDEFVSWLDAYDVLYATSTVFVICFSEARDQLSQWRGYTPHGQGVCLQFDAVQIATSPRF